jgi:hypothetical protein
MPRDKDLKRLVRSRMQKTGEAYTTARSNLLTRSKQAEDSARNQSARSESARSDASQSERSESLRSETITPAPFTAHVVSPRELEKEQDKDYQTIAGMSDVTIREKTGHGWEEWIRIIDEAGGAAMSHGDRASLVNETHRVDGWWSQCVTVGYERLKGMRARGQRMDGSWEATKSRTFAVPVEQLFSAWSDAKVRRRWLADARAKVRTATPSRSLRLQMSDGAIVAVWFTAKGDKSVAGVAHTKLPDEESAERMKGFWTDNLAALAEVLVGAGTKRGAKIAASHRASASAGTRAGARKSGVAGTTKKRTLKKK